MTVLLRIIFLAIVVTACGSSTTSQTAPSDTTGTRSVASARVVDVRGDQKSGVSAPFDLAGGSYTVDWTTTADQARCAFYLFLAKTVNGETIKDVPESMMPEVKTYSGTAEWTGVQAGAYILQEDRTGVANCRGSWSATLTPHP